RTPRPAGRPGASGPPGVTPGSGVPGATRSPDGVVISPTAAIHGHLLSCVCHGCTCEHDRFAPRVWVQSRDCDVDCPGPGARSHCWPIGQRMSLVGRTIPCMTTPADSEDQYDTTYPFPYAPPAGAPAAADKPQAPTEPSDPYQQVAPGQSPFAQAPPEQAP